MIDIHKHLVWVFASREPHIQVSVIEYTCRQRQSKAVEKFWVKLLLIVFFATYMICSSAAIDHIRAASPIICGGLHLAIVPRPDITFSLTLKRTLARCNYHPFQACCHLFSLPEIYLIVCTIRRQNELWPNEWRSYGNK